MAYKMQCQKCKNWINVGKSQIYVPTHGVSKDSLKAKCPGSGRVPENTKGWKSGEHPPSIMKGAGGG